MNDLLPAAADDGPACRAARIDDFVATAAQRGARHHGAGIDKIEAAVAHRRAGGLAVDGFVAAIDHGARGGATGEHIGDPAVDGYADGASAGIDDLLPTSEGRGARRASRRNSLIAATADYGTARRSRGIDEFVAALRSVVLMAVP